MKDYNTLKTRAIEFRKIGLSYGDIKKKLNVSKSTLSLWLKNVPLTEEQKKKFYTNKILNLIKGPQSQKERRSREIEEIIKIAEKEVRLPLTKDSLRLMGAALYWAEGRKSGLCEITNSDPHLILFMVKWFDLIFGIKAINLKARLNIYPQQNETTIKAFWSELTGIPTKNFGKTFVKPLSKGYKKNNLYYGTIRIEVPKSVDIKHRIFGWISSVLKNNTEVEFVQKRWRSLEQIERPLPVNLK